MVERPIEKEIEKVKQSKREENESFLILYRQFMAGMTEEDGRTRVRIDPVQIETLFMNWINIRFARYTHRMDILRAFMTEMKEKDARKIYEKMPKSEIVGGIAGDLLESCRDGLKDSFVEAMLATMLFSVNSQSHQKWNTLSDQMKPYVEVMEKVKKSLALERRASEKAEEMESFEKLWKKQSKKGTTIV